MAVPLLMSTVLLFIARLDDSSNTMILFQCYNENEGLLMHAAANV
jgi:hypothetical protein